MNLTSTDVQNSKSRIKEQIEAECQGASSGERLSFILDRIRSYNDAKEPDDLLSRYIYCISALVHHSRNGGLNLDRISKLENLAFNILIGLGVKPVRSNLAFLYGELYLIMSQIDREMGNHQRAAWQQRVANYFSKDKSIGTHGFQSLSQANRLLRLGHVDKSLDLYTAAYADEETNERSRVHAYLGALKCVRLRGDLHNFQALCHAAQESVDFDEDERLELSWEERCFEVASSKNALPLIQVTRSKGSHCLPIYILESILWIYSLPSKRFFSHVPSIEYLLKKFGHEIRQHKTLLKACEVLIEVYDVNISLHVRLNFISLIMNKSSSFFTIEQYLLFLVGACRFLMRSKLHSLAEFCILEYSRTIKDGEGYVSDPLSIAGDLTEKFGLEK